MLAAEWLQCRFRQRIHEVCEVAQVDRLPQLVERTDQDEPDLGLPVDALVADQPMEHGQHRCELQHGAHVEIGGRVPAVVRESTDGDQHLVEIEEPAGNVPVEQHAPGARNADDRVPDHRRRDHGARHGVVSLNSHPWLMPPGVVPHQRQDADGAEQGDRGAEGHPLRTLDPATEVGGGNDRGQTYGDQKERPHGAGVRNPT